MPSPERSPQEIAILVATRASPFAQNARQLAQNAETGEAYEAINRLVQRAIFDPIEGYATDGTYGIVYGYAGNDEAQRLYCLVHRLPPPREADA